MKRVAVLGSTGSIGTSCLDVIRQHRDQFSVAALTANSKWPELADQCREFRPQVAVLADDSLGGETQCQQAFEETELRFGYQAIEDIAASDDVDIVIAGIVGAAGLRGTWAAIEAGKRVGLANKETLVVAGPLVADLANKSGAEIIPVDSEHSAIHQALMSGRREDLKRIVLTASGGPFRGKTLAELENVTPKDALAHPTWDMGPKITIDSATMMNKALELIEAKWLFDLRADQIEVVVHPQSIVHSFVEFVDGSVIAQLSPPDMRLPIQYALTYPERLPGNHPAMDWKTAFTLQFEVPDEDAFPALKLGREVAEQGGTCGAVLNAANEAAVARFLDGTLRFTEIPRVCSDVMDSHHFDPNPTLDQLFQLDDWGRREVQRWRG
ncbi:1-deoxy-D-xylulose-5-phosphate reductoisomerase [Calycomorphotria hydatis]|uniref:1-deoxy-D-xylulose 5-phosphate reductoisomerase n=1 Tax=Calycomorphotria hydatis TaxID=2528027 RepID=A0A517TB51_9PLAN|nr:1-deoxy-D-xylulose-5-phosphate reductoisomerase [Calycomorphotria hydatis]QDT65599.1 1-deoxy-D-xylulose 5-phosphate reductoisomerase [Calycomorphotria hydatis]